MQEMCHLACFCELQATGGTSYGQLQGCLGLAHQQFTAQYNGSGVPQMCSHCGAKEVPSISHVLRRCAKFNLLRTFTSIPPQSEMVARLGWGEYMAERPLLLQLASIRAADCKLRENVRRRARNGVGGAAGFSLPGLAEMMLQPSFLASFPGCRHLCRIEGPRRVEFGRGQAGVWYFPTFANCDFGI